MYDDIINSLITYISQTYPGKKKAEAYRWRRKDGWKEWWKEEKIDGKKEGTRGKKQKKTLDIIIRRENPESRNPVEIKSWDQVCDET